MAWQQNTNSLEIKQLFVWYDKYILANWAENWAKNWAKNGRSQIWFISHVLLLFYRDIIDCYAIKVIELQLITGQFFFDYLSVFLLLLWLCCLFSPYQLFVWKRKKKHLIKTNENTPIPWLYRIHFIDFIFMTWRCFAMTQNEIY